MHEVTAATLEAAMEEWRAALLAFKEDPANAPDRRPPSGSGEAGLTPTARTLRTALFRVQTQLTSIAHLGWSVSLNATAPVGQFKAPPLPPGTYDGTPFSPIVNRPDDAWHAQLLVTLKRTPLSEGIKLLLADPEQFTITIMS